VFVDIQPNPTQSVGLDVGRMALGKLADRSVQSAKSGRHGDGSGPFLVVSDAGRRKWVLRYQARGVRRDMGLGTYPEVSLSEARDDALDARKRLRKGIDPIDKRRTDEEEKRKAARPIPTFGEYAKQVIAKVQADSTNAKVRYQWERHLGEAYSGPLVDRPVNAITTLEVEAVLEPVWRYKPEVARKLLPAIRRVFEHARVQLKAEHGIIMPENPADWRELKARDFSRRNSAGAVIRRCRMLRWPHSWPRSGRGTRPPLARWNS
jgi:Arm DNA-binding domain